MKNKKRKIIIISLAAVFVLLFVLPFTLAVIIYEGNFGERYESYSPMSRSIDEFKGLNMQRYTFTSNNGQELVGYQYFKNAEDAVGIVVIAHGLGGGGHNSYMNIADYFATNGYIVFAYDATGNDESQGSSVKGIPQGLIDLDYAIRFVKEETDFANLPIMLFGHSWGAYSAGSVLNYHPDVNAIVMVAGFNKSMDIIEEEGRRIAGKGMDILLPYISLYERIKFGEYSTYSSVQGFENSTARIMIIHSTDDEMISSEHSFDIFHDRYKNNPRFHFVQYKDRGHDWVWYTENARIYKDNLNKAFDSYLKSLEEEFTPKIKADYLNKNLDKNSLYELDEETMRMIVDFYNNSKTPNPDTSLENVVETTNSTDNYDFILPEGTTLATRINPPKNYKRTQENEESFTTYMRNFKLKEDKSPVLLYNGDEKQNQSAHVAVFDLALENKDLQQCADSIIRIYAEYFWTIGDYEKIAFHLTNNFLMDYVKWRDGYRLSVSGNDTSWSKSADYDDSYQTFLSYLERVFMYAGTLSLNAECHDISQDEISPGDMFIQGGSPGHCVMVIDIAENSVGKKAFLLAQGFMPAQNFHVLKNPQHSEDPWYYVEELTYPFKTPQWSFDEGSLKRWFKD